MIPANRERLSATGDCGAAVLATDATFIMVPTPSESDGGFSMKYVLSAAEQIGAALRNKTGLASGGAFEHRDAGIHRRRRSCRRSKRHSGKKCGRDFGLCYNPEFIALGSVIRDMLNPDMILIGESDARSGELLEELYNGVCESNPRIQRMNYVNAELTKLSVNTFVTTKISYANMLAQVCETPAGRRCGRGHLRHRMR